MDDASSNNREAVILAFVKFLHLLSLMLGATASFGNLVIAWHVKRSGTPPAPQLTALRPVLGMIGLLAIMAIWITGLWLYIGWYGLTPLGEVFWIKVLLAAALLVLIVMLNRVTRLARAAGNPPPGWIPAAHRVAAALLVAIVALAVWAFR